VSSVSAPKPAWLRLKFSSRSRGISFKRVCRSLSDESNRTFATCVRKRFPIACRYDLYTVLYPKSLTPCTTLHRPFKTGSSMLGMSSGEYARSESNGKM
jgi:hypothetical protein